MRSVIPILVALVVMSSAGVGIVAADPISPPTSPDAPTAAVNNTTSNASSGGGVGQAPRRDVIAQGVGENNDIQTSQTVVNGSSELWRHEFHNGELNDFLIDSVTLDDGSVISAGYIVTEDNHVDALVVKIGPDGEVDWERQFGGDESDIFWGLTATGDGGALLVGDTNSPSYTGGGQSYEGLVMKISADGSSEWGYTLGTEEDEFLGDVASTDDGYILVGDQNDLDSQDVDPWTVTLDQYGNVVNSEVKDTNTQTSYWGVDRGDTGEIVATGTTRQEDGSFGGYLSKLTSSGDVEWNTDVPVEEDRNLRYLSATVASDGDIVASGDSFDPADGTYHAAVTRFDPKGTEQWTRMTVTEDMAFGWDVEKVGDDVLMPVVLMSDDGTIQTVNVEINDSGPGSLAFSVTGLAGYSMSTTADGNIVLAGQSYDGGERAASIGAYEYDGDSDGEDDSSNADHLLRYELAEVALSPGESTTLDIVLTNGTDGVGAFNYINATVASTSAVEITDISTNVSGSAETTVADDGTEAAVRVPFGGDTQDTGNITIATITVKAQEPGEAQLDLEQTGSISNEAGQLYSDVEVQDSTVSVEAGPPSLPGFTDAPTDPDGDGAYEDLNGNGELDIGDVQALFANQNSDAVQNNVKAFDFNGNEQIDIGDVQSLFNEIVGSS